MLEQHSNARDEALNLERGTIDGRKADIRGSEKYLFVERFELCRWTQVKRHVIPSEHNRMNRIIIADAWDGHIYAIYSFSGWRDLVSSVFPKHVLFFYWKQVDIRYEHKLLPSSLFLDGEHKHTSTSIMVWGFRPKKHTKCTLWIFLMSQLSNLIKIQQTQYHVSATK